MTSLLVVVFLSSATSFAENPHTEYKIRCRRNFTGILRIDVCADISENATEGHKACIYIPKVRFGLKWRKVDNPS
ncbi:MAG: hypothetical protein KBS57_03750, partial [Alistipes sp.]|nr:hypothetical protein [Candidatus Minthomonas equi]